MKRTGIACCIATLLGALPCAALAQRNADILWRNTATGWNVIWQDGDYRRIQRVAPMPLDWQVVGVSVSGFNGMNFVLWRNRVDGRNVMWPSAGRDAALDLPTIPKQTWTLAGVGGFDTHTSVFDLLWRDTSTGQDVLWRIGTGRYDDALATIPVDWKIAGIGDFDGDHYSDVLWRNLATGANSIWLRANPQTRRTTATLTDRAWQVAGIGDFDGDHVSDILWRNTATGRNAYWKRGIAANSVQLPNVSTSWRVVGIGDFDGNGKSDVLWRDTATGRNVVWPSAYAPAARALATIADPSWTVAAVGNFDLDPWSF